MFLPEIPWTQRRLASSTRDDERTTSRHHNRKLSCDVNERQDHHSMRGTQRDERGTNKSIIRRDNVGTWSVTQPKTSESICMLFQIYQRLVNGGMGENGAEHEEMARKKKTKQQRINANIAIYRFCGISSPTRLFLVSGPIFPVARDGETRTDCAGVPR